MSYASDVVALAAEGSAARAAGEGDRAGDAALRALGADDLPLRRPGRREPRGGARPALDGDRLHRAARPDARVRARARAGPASTRSCSRRATGARSGSRRRSRCSRSSGSPSSSRCRRSRRSSRGVGWRTVAAVALADIGICAVGTLTGAMAVAGRARELLLPLLFLPLAIPIVVGGVGASAGAGGEVPRVPRRSTTASSSCSRGRLRVRRRRDVSPGRPARLRFRPVKRALERIPLPALAGATAVLFAARDRADLLLRADRRRPGPLAEDLLLPRPDRAHRLRLLRLGRLEGAAPPLEAAARARTSRATSRSTRA